MSYIDDVASLLDGIRQSGEVIDASINAAHHTLNEYSNSRQNYSGINLPGRLEKDKLLRNVWWVMVDGIPHGPVGYLQANYSNELISLTIMVHNDVFMIGPYDSAKVPHVDIIKSAVVTLFEKLCIRIYEIK